MVLVWEDVKGPREGTNIFCCVVADAPESDITILNIFDISQNDLINDNY